MTRKDVAFNVEFTEQINEYGKVEKWPVLTWSWDGGSITIRDWETVELNGAEYMTMTALNPIFGFSEQERGGIAVLYVNDDGWEKQRISSGTVTGAVIRRDGSVYPTRTADGVLVTVQIDDANHDIQCDYRELDNMLRLLYAHGVAFPSNDERIGVSRKEYTDWKTRCHVSQLVPDVDLDPDVWGGLFD